VILGPPANFQNKLFFLSFKKITNI